MNIMSSIRNGEGSITYVFVFWMQEGGQKKPGMWRVVGTQVVLTIKTMKQ